MALRLALLLQLTCLALAVNYVHDETVWTKQTWPAFKLQFPAQKVLQAAGHTAAFSHISNLGPFREDSYPQTYAGTSDVYKDTVPDEVLGLLAELIKCRACRILTNNTWQWGTNWLHKTGLHLTEEQLTEQMQAMCEITVPRDLLKDYAIVQAEGTLSGVALPPGVTPAMVQTFSMQGRDKTSPTAYEHMAVQRACHQLLSNSMSDALERPPLPALLTIFKEGFKSYEATRSALLDEDEEDGRTADPNALQQDCPDKHEKCPFWAHIGECEKNMQYMVGFTDKAGEQVPGHCQLSCGTCTLISHSGLSVEGDKSLKAASRKLQAQTGKAACAATGACSKSPTYAGASTPSVAPSPAAAGTASTDSHQESQSMQTPTKVAAQLELGQSIGPVGHRRSADRSMQSEWADYHLSHLIGNQCLYITKGWWSYEVCCLSHINQFHAENNHLQAAHSLGMYDYETGAVPGFSKPTMLDYKDLLPGMKVTKAVATQLYSNGAECEVTEFNEGYHNAEETSMLRSTELRLACSPDKQSHMIIREPAQCVYIITLYLPALCQAIALPRPAILTDHNEL
ncbi:hypothetical protein WJX77_005622 [Trebouxia sp. C0004]